MTDNIFPVVIIGGGIAGLTAAITLADNDIPPLVLEADNEWAGGRLAGGAPDYFTYSGRTWEFPSEHGMHALWGSYTNMRAILDRYVDIHMLESLGEEWINRWGDQVRHVEAGSGVRWGFVPAPLHYLQLLLRPRFWGTITILDFLSLPGFLTSLFLTLGMDPIREKNSLDGLKLKDYFVLWTPNLKATFTGIGVNMLAANAEEIDLAAFIAALRFYTILRRDYWSLTFFPKNAHDSVIKPLTDGVVERGGMIMRGARARALVRDGEDWIIRIEDARLGGMRQIKAKQVIMAVEPSAAQKLLDNSPDTPIDGLIFPKVTRNSTVRLWFDIVPRQGAASGMFTGDFLMDNFFWLHRIHDEFRLWHKSTGGSVLEVHIYNRDSIIDLSDNLIKIQIIAEVQRAFPELRGHLVHSAYRSNGYHQTQFRVPDGHSIHVDTPWSGILACGDWIGHPHPSLNMERSVVTAIAAANRVLETYDQVPVKILPPPPSEPFAKIIEVIVRGGRLLLGPIIVRLLRLRK